MATYFTDSYSSGSETETEFTDENSEDLSHSEIHTLPNYLVVDPACWKSLQLSHNQFVYLPQEIGTFVNLVSLDISNNGLSVIGNEMSNLKKLKSFTARNNLLDSSSIPKDFGCLTSLELLNLSGNRFVSFPPQFTELVHLKHLYIGANKLTALPGTLKFLQCLEVLYLGGNSLTEMPAEIGYLQKLMSLTLCDNQLHSLPPTMANLQNLRSLSLHNNQLSTMPPQIVALNLVELSLRNNPLVVRFVQDLTIDPPSLLELAGRVVKIEKLTYTAEDLPMNLMKYLAAAQRCVNPNCKGVYFNSKVENIKFVDFCGKYRLPLLQYLCSPKCTHTPAYSDSDTDDENSAKSKMKRVLLG